MVFSLAGCSAIVTTPQVQLQRIAPTGIGSSGLDLDVNLLINNPNRFDLTLLGYSYALQVSGLPFSSGGARQTIVFSGQQETPVKIPVRIRHSDLLELLKHQPDLDRISYRLTAGLQVDTPLGEMSVPVDHQGQFSIPEKYRPTTLMQRLKGLFSPF